MVVVADMALSCSTVRRFGGSTRRRFDVFTLRRFDKLNVAHLCYPLRLFARRRDCVNCVG
jgi:hypothetical protein